MNALASQSPADQPGNDQPENDQLRPHAEFTFAAELKALAASDDRPRPPRWRLSPWAVVDYLIGGTRPDSTVIAPNTRHEVSKRRMNNLDLLAGRTSAIEC